MNISKEELRKMIKEEIEKVVVDNIIKEGFTARDAAAAPEVKQKLADYGLKDVDSYSDREIADALMVFIYSFGNRVNSVEDTIKRIDSRYSPDGEYRRNKPEDRPTPGKDMARALRKLVTVSDRKPSRYDSYADDADFEDRQYRRRMAKRDRRAGFPKRGQRGY